MTELFRGIAILTKEELSPSFLLQITAIGLVFDNIAAKFNRCGNQAAIMEVDDTLKMNL